MKPHPSLIDNRNTNYLPWFLLASLGLNTLVVIMLLGQWLALHRLSKRDLAFVQLETGEILQMRAVESRHRTPETVRTFVTQVLYMTFNWSGEIAGANGQPIADKGQDIEIDNRRVKVPTSTQVAIHAFSPEIQKPILAKIAEIVPPGVFNGTTQAVLTLDNVSAEEIENGRWLVRVVGHHRVVGQSLPGKVVPFNKQVFVEALSAPAVPEEDTPLERSIYRLRTSGLQIYTMNEFTGVSHD